jgi:F-type H+-transporting ATPase subunit epsilon
MAGPNRLHLRIVTPEEEKLDERCDMVIMRCITGDMGILPGREPCMAILDYGVLRILYEVGERRVAVFGGIAQVRDDSVTILANEAQWAKDIDRFLAESDMEEALKRLREAKDDTDLSKQQVALRRALVQIEVSSYPLLSQVKHEEEPENSAE